MKLFRVYPFIRLLGFQLAGISVANLFPSTGKLLYALLICLIVTMVVLIRRRRHSFALIPSILLSALIVIISYTRTRIEHAHPFKTDQQTLQFEAELLGYPIEKANSMQVIARIRQSVPSAFKGQKLLLYLEKGEKSDQIRAGDRIYARVVPKEIKNQGNPFEFDFRNYMARKQIWYSAYIRSENYLDQKTEHPSLLPAVLRIQHRLVERLKQKLNSDQAFQVIAALTLGYRDEVSRETQSCFISTGAMHVLSVSGLHVAMIFLFLHLLFGCLKKSSVGRVLYFFIIISSLWGYALLTGFSPPVQRSVIMFTFILAGNSLERTAPVYNSIAASAFFLLFFNPDLLFDIGFQLSYMAVFSIVFFYRRLTGILKIKNKPLTSIWQLCCVSIAAQLGTFPLAIYYFNQFPVYFWLSNFIVVPAGYLLLGLTGAFFAFSWSDPVIRLISQALVHITDMTLFLLQRIGNFPFAVIDRLALSPLQFFCLLCFTGCCILFIVSKKHVLFFSGLSFLLLLQIDGLIQKTSLLNQRKLIIYQTGVIHLINGRDNYLITGTNEPPNPFLYKNVILRLRLKEPLIFHTMNREEETPGDLIIREPVIQFTDKSFLLKKKGQPRISQEYSLSFPTGLIDLNQIRESKIEILLN